MEAGAPRTLPWALLTSVSLHVLAASWIAPPGAHAVRDTAPLQALLIVTPPRERAAEVTRAVAPMEQPRAADKPIPRGKPRIAVRPAQPTRPTPVLAAANVPSMTLPATETTAPLPAAAETSLPVAASTVVAAAAPTAAATPISPPSFHADYLDNPKPSYPAAARRRGLQGETRLEVLVAANGLPREVKIARSSGHEELDEAARAAVKYWRFVPARRGEEKVDAWVAVPIAFRLDR